MTETELNALEQPFVAIEKQAAANVDEWGLQDRETLLLAMQEELGELTRAHLEAEHEDGAHQEIVEEWADLGALLVQFHWRIANDE